jgi:hypothetical protein
MTGSVSNEEIACRSLQGNMQYVPPGFNESELEAAGFRLLETEDRTASVERNASGRLAASLAHRAELEALIGAEEFERQRIYLETVVALSQTNRLSRLLFLAESRGPDRARDETRHRIRR